MLFEEGVCYDESICSLLLFVGRGCLIWPVHPLGKTLLAFALFHSVLQGQICLLLQVFPDFLLAFQSPIMKRTSFGGVSSKRSCSFQFSHSVVSDSLWPHESQHARPPGPSPLPEFNQTHAHRVGDAIQPSHPLSSPFPPAPNPSQHQSISQWVNSLHEVAKVLEFQL